MIGTEKNENMISSLINLKPPDIISCLYEIDTFSHDVTSFTKKIIE